MFDCLDELEFKYRVLDLTGEVSADVAGEYDLEVVTKGQCEFIVSLDNEELHEKLKDVDGAILFVRNRRHDNFENVKAFCDITDISKFLQVIKTIGKSSISLDYSDLSMVCGDLFDVVTSTDPIEVKNKLQNAMRDNSLIVYLEGGDDLSLEKMNDILNSICDRRSSNIIFSSGVDKTLTDVKITVITSVKM